MLNVLNTAEKLVVANAATKALFGTDVASFALDGWARPQGTGSDNSWEISAAELVTGLIPGGAGFGFGSQYLGAGGNLMTAVQRNLQANGPQAIGTMILAPVAFTVAKRVLGKPLINPTNKLLRQAGLGTVLKI
jgi:hypothetical protein